ncbi:phosphotransferase enzyme family protein [Demequina sp.]|uniref:phosphotransferase enzyme family protein n=1 Tax=Demequina sp. TaxID=2050685 RepID=UPI003D0F739C
MEARLSQLRRLRAVAAAALAEYPLPDGPLTFVTHGENTTYRLDGPAGKFLVRVHRPLRHGRDADPVTAIESELAWLVALRAETSLTVPEPVFARDGAVTVTATAAGLTRVVSVLRWIDGRIMEDSARAVHFRRLGAAMAVLHQHADSWTPPADFTRIRWDHEAFFGNTMVYGNVSAAECWELLPSALRDRFAAVGSRMSAVMAAESDSGLIHADLHMGNAVFRGTTVGLIDFDDSGFGPRIYDLAVALWEQRDEPESAQVREALLDGYRSVRPIDDTLLDDYIAVRQVAFDLWYTGTAQVNPAFAARLDVVHDWSSSMLGLLGY